VKLSDIMGAAGLTSWAEIGLIISFVTFAAIVAYVFIVRSRASYEEVRNLPLDDEAGAGARSDDSDDLQVLNRGMTMGRTGKSSESSDLAPPEVSP
jgi:cbb3-type cytochrome oxidase subunit 3